MLQHYTIAGLPVKMDVSGKTERQARPYVSPPCPDALPIVCDAAAFQRSQPHLALEDCEYILTGAAFYRSLLAHNGLLLHASAVVMNGRAYLFSAPCGTGKSTHTALWQEVFGKENARILNDDKPALRLENGSWFAYGTPWSGKSDLNLNLRVPLAGICFLSRGKDNIISPFSGPRAVYSLLEQTVRPRDPDSRSELLRLLDELFRHVPVWQLRCNMEPEAARVSYAAMSAEKGTQP